MGASQAHKQAALELPELLRRERPLLLDTVYRLFREKPLGAFSLLIVLLLMAMAALAPVLATHDPSAIEQPLHSPSRQFFFGTDGMGRDVYSRVVYGARVSVVVGFGAIGVSIVLSTLLGLVSGYAGGVFDALMQRLVDALMAFPWLILLLTLVAAIGAGVPQLLLALGIISAAGGSRIVRSAVVGVKSNQYVEAARALGAGPLRVMHYHVLPNVLAPMIVAATTGLGSVILAEASLSFLGFGVPPPTPSWGGMLSGDGLRFMRLAPWIAIFPGLAITLVVYGFNMLGDALRDILDPRMRGADLHSHRLRPRA